MGKHRKAESQSEFDESELDEFLDYLEDENFFESSETYHSRAKPNKKRDARRRIEDYWDDRRLAEQLDEYYYHMD